MVSHSYEFAYEFVNCPRVRILFRKLYIKMVSGRYVSENALLVLRRWTIFYRKHQLYKKNQLILGASLFEVRFATTSGVAIIQPLQLT